MCMIMDYLNGGYSLAISSFPEHFFFFFCWDECFKISICSGHMQCTLLKKYVPPPLPCANGWRIEQAGGEDGGGETRTNKWNRDHVDPVV